MDAQGLHIDIWDVWKVCTDLERMYMNDLVEQLFAIDHMNTRKGRKGIGYGIGGQQIARASRFTWVSIVPRIHCHRSQQ